MLKKFEDCKVCEGNGHVFEDGNNHECNNCGGDGIIEKTIDENQIVYVNVYSITRHYGGPEEGGWYYNNFECLEVYPVKNKNSELMKEQLEKDYAHIKHGNIYSVLGGTDLEVFIEERPKQSETKVRPYYE